MFAIGALDNFLHELILEIVPKFGGDRGALKEPLKSIARSDPALALRVALAGPGEAEQEFRAALDGWLESQSFHGVQKILAGTGFLKFTLKETTLHKDWRRELETSTEERHQIVRRGSTKVIKRDEAKACTDLVEAMVKAINEEVVKYYH